MGLPAKVVDIADAQDRQKNKGRTGRPRASEEMRERSQRSRATKRGATKKVKPDAIEKDDLLPPLSEVQEHGLTGYGERWYNRIRQEQLQYHWGKGNKAFLKASDTPQVVAAAHLFHAHMRLIDAVRAEEPHVDANLYLKSNKAINEYRKALFELGYVPGMMNHIDLKDVDENELEMFGD